MHLVVDTTRQQIQPFRVDYPIGRFVNMAIYLLYKTVINKQVGNKLFVLIYNGSGFDEDG